MSVHKDHTTIKVLLHLNGVLLKTSAGEVWVEDSQTIIDRFTINRNIHLVEYKRKIVETLRSR